jgi:hypothetical protein
VPPSPTASYLIASELIGDGMLEAIAQRNQMRM